MTYCTDIDLLDYEPTIFKDAAIACQTISAGTGTLQGVNFTRVSGSFIDDNVKGGCVLTLTAEAGGSFPVVNLVNATQLRVSANDEAFIEDGAASPAGNASNQPFVVRTFYPQRKMITEMINNAAGIGVGTALPEAMLLSNPALKRACVLGTFHVIYNAIRAMNAENESLVNRAEFYRVQFLRALRRLTVEIDVDDDGECDVIRHLGSLRLQRA